MQQQQQQQQNKVAQLRVFHSGNKNTAFFSLFVVSTLLWKDYGFWNLTAFSMNSSSIIY